MHENKVLAICIQFQIWAFELEQSRIIRALFRILYQIMITKDQVFPAMDLPDKLTRFFWRNVMTYIPKNIEFVCRLHYIIDILNEHFVHLSNI